MAIDLRGVGISRLPTRHQLDAALVAATALVDESGVSRAGAAGTYAHLPTGGIFTVADLLEGQQLLARAGLVQDNGVLLLPMPMLRRLYEMPREVARPALLSFLLETMQPLWVQTAVRDGEVVDALLPDDVQEELVAVFPDERARHAFLRNVATKVDQERNSRVGEIAEIHVTEECVRRLQEQGWPALAEDVARVSLVSDHWGFDVHAPRPDGAPLHLEVKGTTSAGFLAVVHLSRNEAERAGQDPDWRLVVCSVDLSESSADVLGWVRGEQLTSLLPKDQLGGARWTSAEIKLVVADLASGLPE